MVALMKSLVGNACNALSRFLADCCGFSIDPDMEMAVQLGGGPPPRSVAAAVSSSSLGPDDWKHKCGVSRTPASGPGSGGDTSLLVHNLCRASWDTFCDGSCLLQLRFLGK